MQTETTGIQVAPVASEEDMNALKTLFERVAASIVQASQYPKQVNELHSELDKLRTEVESLRSHNSALDGTIIELRSERDTWRTNAENAAYARDEATRRIGDMDRTISEQQAKLDTLSHDLDTTKAERDNYGLRAMQLEDEINGWKLRAEESRKRLGDMLSLLRADEPQPEPTPEPVPPAPEPVTVSEPFPWAVPEAPKPTEEPSPAQAPTPYPETRDSWSAGWVWDTKYQAYIRDPMI